MEIQILYGLEQAHLARGTAVIIDVFRAFSTACYVAANGAARIIPIASVEEAFALKAAMPDAVLMGERLTKKVEGFDFGNSPAEIEEVDFTGKTVLHATTHGTCGVVAAAEADEVIGGSFVNAAAVVRHVKATQAAKVTLVALGYTPPNADDEDSSCAHYLEALLEGGAPSFDAVRDHIKRHRNSQKFFDPQRPWTPPRDFELCMMVDRFDFVLRAGKGPDGLLSVTPVQQ